MDLNTQRDLSPTGPRQERPLVLRYGVAVFLSAIAALISGVLAPHIAPYTTPPYMVAVMIAAAYGGAGPGLLATAIATLSLAWFSPGSASPYTMTGGNVAELAVFGIAAIAVSSLAASRSAAQRSLSRALGKLSEIDRAKDEFIAALSHELRTPLTSIIGWTSMLRDSELDAETRHLAIKSIEQSATTQKMIVDDLLDVSRIILGKFEIQREPVNLQAIVDDSVAVIRPSAEEKGVSIQLQQSATPLEITADAGRLKQVMWNLLSNAVKFTPAGGTVTARTDQRRASAVIEVCDTGQGIDEDVLPMLFERFQQGRDSVRRGGLGLGLAIAKSIVEQHHGSITACSRGKGQGSTFRVTLPLTAAESRSETRNAIVADQPAELATRG